jgi:hypothetical protein
MIIYRGLPEPTVFVEGTYRKEFGKEESDRIDELIAKIKAHYHLTFSCA